MKKPNRSVTKAIKVAGSLAELSRQLGVTPQTVKQWENGDRPVPVRFCPAIERVTDGAVRRQKLRPDWREIWPELAEAAHA